MPGTVPIPTLLYRIVHFQNIEFILRNGIYTRAHANHDPNYVNIGDTQLIADRHEYPVKLEGYGNLGDYVPFYFGPHSPMLYKIKNGTGVKQYPQSEIVYLVVLAQSISDNGLRFACTSGHAKNKLTSFYNNLNSLNEVHWDIVNLRHWNNNLENPDRMWRKQAEFLIHNHVPINLIAGIVVYNQEKFNFVDSLMKDLGLNIPLTISTNLYY